MKVTTILLALKSPERTLLPLVGRPVLQHCLGTADAVSSDPAIVIAGGSVEAVQAAIGADNRVFTCDLAEGETAAIQLVEPLLAGEGGLVLVAWANMPLLRQEALQWLVDTQAENSGPLSFLNAVDEAAPAVICFRADWLLQQVDSGAEDFSGLVQLAEEEGLKIEKLVPAGEEELLCIEDNLQLAQAENVMRRRINQKWMLKGVVLIDPATAYIGPDVRIGAGTQIFPNTHLRGSAEIGEGCSIGPNTIIDSSRIGNRCKVLSSVIDPGATLEDNVDMGPFAHLRKGAYLAEGVHMGNFGEIKNSYLGPGVKMGHFSYLGDASIGENVNIGAGTITCNYDGVNKHPTEIGANAFIGSDTMLVAPLKIGENANTGAGAVVTRDVPPNSVVVGVPARRIDKKKKKKKDK